MAVELKPTSTNQRNENSEHSSWALAVSFLTFVDIFYLTGLIIAKIQKPYLIQNRGIPPFRSSEYSAMGARCFVFYKNINGLFSAIIKTDGNKRSRQGAGIMGEWVFSHYAKTQSRLTKDNDNVICGGTCTTCSSDGNWCADVVTMSLTLNNDPTGPKRRFKQMTKEELMASGKLGTPEGPTTHWELLGISYDAALRNVTVTVQGFTSPQRFEVSIPVEEYRE